MIRGSGLKGLVSLEKKTTFNKVNLIRPLLNFNKKDLEYISNYVFNFFCLIHLFSKFKKIKNLKYVKNWR